MLIATIKNFYRLYKSFCHWKYCWWKAFSKDFTNVFQNSFAKTFLLFIFLGLENLLCMSQSTRGPKNQLPLLGHCGQLYSWFKAAYVYTDLLFLYYKLYSQICTFISANYWYPPKNSSLYLGSQSSYIQNLKLHTLAFLLPSSQNNKQTNPLGMILARICCPEIVR